VTWVRVDQASRDCSRAFVEPSSRGRRVDGGGGYTGGGWHPLNGYSRSTPLPHENIYLTSPYTS